VPTDDDTRVVLKQYVAAQLRGQILWTKLWSLLHHGFVFGAVILSAAAALVLQLKSILLTTEQRSDIATVLTAIASVVGVISVSGAFAQKWRTNRLTKGTLEQIEIDLMDPNCDYRKLLEELKEMKRIHHLAIAGESDESRSGGRLTPARDPPNPTLSERKESHQPPP